MQYLRFTCCLLAAVLAFAGCEKDPYVSPTPLFSVHVQNDYSEIQSRFALFLSDADGKLLAFRWLPGNDTAQIRVPDATANDRLDCTVVKITSFEAPGTGIRDTTVQLTTYSQILSGETIRLRDPEYRQVLDFRVNFTDFTSFDSIIVPDGLTFMRPQASNNYTGQYRVYHTGEVWVRVLVNGDPHWRFTRIDNVNGPVLVTTLNVNHMTPIFAKSPKVQFPFVSTWRYKVDGIIDSAGKTFLPIGDLLRAPGGFVPTFDQLTVIEPNSGDAQIQVPLPYQLYRFSAEGPNSSGDNYHYYIDKIYKTLPQLAPVPDFDINATALADNRSVAVQCVGKFDVLSFNWTSNSALKANWEVLARPGSDIVAYHLPEVPTALSDLYAPLRGYRFSDDVRVRAESYDQYNLFEAIVREKLRNPDPLWQSRAGYLAREEVF